MRYVFFALILSGLCLICACNPSGSTQSESPESGKNNKPATASTLPDTAEKAEELPPLPGEEAPLSAPSIKSHWDRIAELEQSLQSVGSQEEAIEKFKTVATEIVSELETIIADAQATEYDVSQAVQQSFEILTLQLQLNNASAYDKIIALPESLRQKGYTELSDELSIKLYEIKLAYSVEHQDVAQFNVHFNDYIAQVEATTGEKLDFLLSLAPRIAQFSEYLNDTTVAPGIYSKLVSVLNSKTESYAKTLVKLFSSQVKRVSLPGNSMLISGIDMEGKPFSPDSFKGKVLLIDFWATWCDPCIEEMKNIKKIYADFHDKGFDVLGVSLDETAGSVSNFIEKNEIPWTQALDSKTKLEDGKTMAQYYGINAIPCLILIGRDGVVISVSARGEKLEKLIAEQFESTPADSSNVQPDMK